MYYINSTLYRVFKKILFNSGSNPILWKYNIIQYNYKCKPMFTPTYSQIVFL